MPFNIDEIREAEDRSFVVGGETFTLRRVQPDVLDEIQKLSEGLPETVPFSELYIYFEKQLLILVDLQNGDMDRWEKVRNDPRNPITYEEMVKLSMWARESVTGLPTIPPSPSQPGAKTSGSSSKAK